MKFLYSLLLFFFSFGLMKAQDHTLEFFVSQSLANAPGLKENNNLQKISDLQNDIILAQNKAFQVNVTSEVLVAPYFDTNGRVIDITTTPSPRAYGYDVGITNGGLYSAQLNVTKNLFNQSAIDNLLFQNRIQTSSIALSAEEISHNLIKTITDTYILAYQYQLQKDFSDEITHDLENRIQVIELLVKRGVLMESDYLLLQLDIEGKKLEHQQIQSNFKTTINQLYNLSGILVEKVNRLSEPIFSDSQMPTSFFYEKKFENDSLLVEADKSVFENQYKPQITAYANTGLNAVEIQNIDRRIGASAGLRLTIPIYDGKQRKVNALQSELKSENIEFYKVNSKIQLENNLKSIKDQIQVLNDNRFLLEKQLEKQKNLLEIYKGKLVQGQASIIDYLNVVQNFKLNMQIKLQMQTNYWLLQSQYKFINW